MFHSLDIQSSLTGGIAFQPCFYRATVVWNCCQILICRLRRFFFFFKKKRNYNQADWMVKIKTTK